MKNNLDEDIKILTDYIYNKKETMKELLVPAISNVLSEVKEYQKHKKYHCEQLEKVLSEIESYKNRENKELETNKKAVDNLFVKNAELKQELEIYKEEFKKINKALNLEEGRVEPYTTDIIEGLKRCVTQQHKELETYKKIAERYERECRMFRAFCRRIRKDEKRDVDEFNQGREYAYIQFLNLISGEQNWEHEGKYFDEVDKELLDWARKEVEK